MSADFEEFRKATEENTYPLAFRACIAARGGEMPAMEEIPAFNKEMAAWLADYHRELANFYHAMTNRVTVAEEHINAS